MPINKRYLTEEYLRQNPSWDEEDSPWKAQKIINLLARWRISPQSVCEVGCGAGGVLAALRDHLGPAVPLVGYDIAPALQNFWVKHRDQQITFKLADFLQEPEDSRYDILIMVDVIEHLENPFYFLKQVLRRANWFILLIPLELHALGAIRNTPFIRARQKLGHLHFWNKDLTLMMLQDCGMNVIAWEYALSSIELVSPTLARSLARWPRKFFFSLAPNWTARTLGGFSLLVLARPSS